MKTVLFRNQSKFLKIIILSCLALSACNSDEETDIPIFSYASDFFEVSFRTQGTIPAPIIEWSGEEGIFSMESEIPGLSIDETSGELKWERQLDIGEHMVQIIAQNEQQILKTSFVINSVLGNAFWFGRYNNNPDSDDLDQTRFFTFFSNGTLEVISTDTLENIGIGVWEINGNALAMRFCISCEDINPQEVVDYDEHTLYQGTLVNQVSTAYIGGQRSVVRFNPDSEMIRGNFYMEWD